MFTNSRENFGSAQAIGLNYRFDNVICQIYCYPRKKG
jgi:hypothetical protein